MKDFKTILILIFGGSLLFLIYYVTLDNRFELVEDLHDFPVPKKAELERETDALKEYYWDRSDGANIPPSYRLMMWKSGWRVAHVDIGLTYEKEGKYISFNLATDYIAISDFTPYVEMKDEE